MRLIIYTHKRFNHSVRRLYTEFKRDYHINRIFKKILIHSHNKGVEYTQGDVILNWGSSRDILGNPLEVINRPVYNNIVGNKLTFFEHIVSALEEYTPEFTNNKDKAIRWLAQNNKVVERHVLRGHSGEGIIVVDSHKDLTDAPLYTKLITNAEEWRVHVFKNKVLYVQQKKRKKDHPDADRIKYIKSHKNGWVFCTDDIEIPRMINNLATSVMERTNLDFGAVDIIRSRDSGEYTVLEVNTAPNITGTTAEKYVNKIIEYLHSKYQSDLKLGSSRDISARLRMPLSDS